MSCRRPRPSAPMTTSTPPMRIFNKRLFGGRLPPCLITVRPHRGAYGYFSPERFGSRDGKEVHDEIALNIRHFEKRSAVRDPVDAGARDGAPGAGAFRQALAQRLPQQGMGRPDGAGRPGAVRYGRARGQAHRPAGDALRGGGGSVRAAFAARKFTVPYFDRVGESENDPQEAQGRLHLPSRCEDKVWGKPEVKPHCGKCGFAPMIASYDANRIAAAA